MFLYPSRFSPSSELESDGVGGFTSVSSSDYSGVKPECEATSRAEGFLITFLLCEFPILSTLRLDPPPRTFRLESFPNLFLLFAPLEAIKFLVDFIGGMDGCLKATLLSSFKTSLLSASDD